MGGEASAAVIVLTLAVAVLNAFWMSIRRERAYRRLVRWIREHHAERWAALPRSTRWIHPNAVIENLSRQDSARIRSTWRSTPRASAALGTRLPSS